MTERKRICINCAVVVLEALLICVHSDDAWMLLIFVALNNLVYAICSGRATTKFTEMLRSSNYLLFQRHQGALDSRNILTIDRALRKEELSEEERAAMQEAMKYVKSMIRMDIVLIIVVFAKNFSQ